MAANAKNKIFPAPLIGKHEQIVITNAAAVGINGGETPLPATRANIYTNANIRFCIDGTTATTTKGFIAEAGDMVYLQSMEEIDGFTAIATGASGTLDVSYMG